MAFIRPHRIRRTGDDTPTRGLFRFVVRMSGRHQIALVALSLVIAALNVAPLELQRRIVDDAIAPGDVELLLWLAGFYFGAIVALGGLKLFLRLYQGWLAEGTILYCRRHLTALWHERRPAEADDRGEDDGAAVSIVRAEIEAVGGFVGEGFSEPAGQAGVLVAVLTYMVIVEPQIAIMSLIFILPQLLLTPLVQRRLNRLTERRLELLRKVSEQVLGLDADADDFKSLTSRVYRNRVLFFFWKFASKAALNFMNALAPLAALGYGGYLVIQGETELGVVVAFTTGFARLSDPIRQLIAYYRTAAETSVKHDLIAKWM